MTFTQQIMLDFSHTQSNLAACVFNLDLEKSVEVCYTYDGKQISQIDCLISLLQAVNRRIFLIMNGMLS